MSQLAKVDSKVRFHYSDQFLAIAKHHLGDKLKLDQDPPSEEGEPRADQATLDPVNFVKAS